MACDELFTNEEEEYSLYEAVKFLMLNRAIELYDDKEKGREVPFFSVLLFARDTSSDPGQLLRNHLNQVGHTGGLEQVSRAFGSTLTQSSSISLQLLPQFLWVWSSGALPLCGSGSGLQEVAVESCSGLQSLEGSTAAGGSTCSLVHTHLAVGGRAQSLTGGQWEGSVPHYVGLSIGLLKCPPDMAAGFSQKVVQEDSQDAPVPSVV